MAEGSEILVVGAGPTGLTLACELLRHGVSCRIVDKAAGPCAESRATDMHARTLEVFDDMGLAIAMLARGVPSTNVSLFSSGKRVARVRYDDADTPFPYILGIPQYDTEKVLLAHLEHLGGRVERNVRVAALRQNADTVTPTLLHPDGRWEEPTVRYAVGCDGAHSTTRHALELGFEGEPYDELFGLADVRLDYELPPDEVVMFCSESGFVFVLPLPGERRVRLFVDLAPEDEGKISFDLFRRIVEERLGVAARVSDPGWITGFRCHRRLVERYRVGRVFLAGDAAHIHTPTGGHGMNTGIQDAYNLAWKLALVARGRARPELLDSYEEERRPVARAVLLETDLETRMALWRNPIAQGLRDAMTSMLMRVPSLRRMQIAMAMELSFNYRSSPIVGEHRGSVLQTHLLRDLRTETASTADWLDFGSAPRAGDRAPDAPVGQQRLHELLRGTRHTLLLFDGSASTPMGYANLARIAHVVTARFGDLIRVYAVVPQPVAPPEIGAGVSVLLDSGGTLHARYGASAEALYLIRPDGYVGFRSQPADGAALMSYFEKVLGGAAPARAAAA